MRPLMRILMELNGTPDESPQQTHRWNRHAVNRNIALQKFEHRMVHPEPDPEAWPLVSLFIHVPWIGWQNYVVLEPMGTPCTWHIGWVWDGGVSVSRIPLQGPVRMLRGPRPVGFFGVTARDNMALILDIAGYGRLGDGGPYAKFSLL